MLKSVWINFKRKSLAYSFAYLGKYIIRMLLWSCKIEVKGKERFIQLASNEKCILMLWHNRLALVAEVLHQNAPQFMYRALISKSRDADPLAILANSYKCGKTIRVSHNARHQALKRVIQSLKQSHEVIVITPDGPRGPRYRVKPGTAWAARETKASIIPFTWSSTGFWELKTWDRFMLPKPFSTIHVVFGDPISSENEKVAEVGDLTAELQDSLVSLG